MAALVAALLTQASDRTQWLTAMLATRYARPIPVLLGAAAALALGNGVAAAGGALIAAKMSPAARDLLLALALLSGGLSAFWPLKPPRQGSGWRPGALLASFTGVLLLGLGDRTQFITAALAGRSTTPALAAIGATIGAVAVTVASIQLGEARWRALPLTTLRLAIGAVLTLAGAVQAVAALRLI